MSPSILSADFASLAADVQRVAAAGGLADQCGMGVQYYCVYMHGGGRVLISCQPLDGPKMLSSQ